MRHAKTDRGFGGMLKGRKEGQNGLEGLQRRFSDQLQHARDTIAAEVREKPLGWVLCAMGIGLFLGRFKVRPVETVAMAAAAGMAAGLALANGCGHRLAKSD